MYIHESDTNRADVPVTVCAPAEDYSFIGAADIETLSQTQPLFKLALQVRKDLIKIKEELDSLWQKN